LTRFRRATIATSNFYKLKSEDNEMNENEGSPLSKFKDSSYKKM
jgi:hypothetical protein